MTGPHEIGVGKWWRYDKYEVRDGYIRPAQDARLEVYDPWADNQGTNSHTQHRAPPYQPLLELAEGIKFRPGLSNELFTPSSDTEEQLLSWCSKFGLLGVLPHRVHSVILAPRWIRFDMRTFSGFAGDKTAPSGPICPQYLRYFRTNTGWDSTRHFTFRGSPFDGLNGSEHEGHPVSSKHIPDDIPRPGVVIQNLHDQKINEEPLGATWAKFFPDIPSEEQDAYQYSPPLSDDFWRLYAEPVEAFFEGAVALRDAVRDLGQFKPAANIADDDVQSMFRGRAILHALLAPVSPVLIPLKDGTFRQEWAALSLLASLALMVFQDITGRRRLLRCTICGRMFLSDAYQARYCSTKCRHTAQKRRHRARNKEREHG